MTPYLACGDAAAAIDFYKAAFDVKDVDATMQRALAAGGKLVREIKDQFSTAELRRRAEKLVKETGG